MASDETEVKIRKMTEDDLPQINEIDCLIQGKERVVTWPFTAEAHWKTYHPVLDFVAEFDGKVVGFLLENIKRAKSKVPLVGWVDMMGIHPEHQRREIGKKLIEAFYGECKQSSATSAVIVKKNDKKRKRFSKALGFKEEDWTIFEKE